MAGRCTICTHPHRDEVDADLARGVAQRAVAKRLGVSGSSVQRHAARHLRPEIRQAITRRHDLRVGGLADRLAGLATDAASVRQAAMASGDPGMSLRAVDTERAVLTDLAKLVGLDPDSVRDGLHEAVALADAVSNLIQREVRAGGPTLADDLADELDHLDSPELASAIRDVSTRAAAIATTAAREDR